MVMKQFKVMELAPYYEGNEAWIRGDFCVFLHVETQRYYVKDDIGAFGFPESRTPEECIAHMAAWLRKYWIVHSLQCQIADLARLRSKLSAQEVEESECSLFENLA